MKIGYLLAAKSSRIVGNTGDTVHVQSMCHAFRRLGHQVFIVSGELEKIDRSQNIQCPFPLAVIPSPSPLPATSWLYQQISRRSASQSASESLAESRRPAGGYAPTWRPCLVWNDLEQRISAWRYQRHFYRQAYQVLEREQPDVLYERYSQYDLAGIWLAKDLGIPLVLEMNASLTQPREWFHQPSPLYPWMIEQAERYLCRHVDAVVVVSAALLPYLRGVGVQEGKIVILPNAVDPELFQPDEHAALAIRQRHGLVGKFVVGFVGSMRPWHDVATLLEGVRLAAQSRPEVCALIVGDGPSRSALASLAEQAGLVGRVKFVGSLLHQDIVSYIGSMDIAVVLSPADDFAQGGASMKVFEYMAMERPVIASGLGLSDDIIQHRQNGMLVEPEHSAQVAEAILELANDADLRMKLGKAARQTVENKHTWEQNAQAVIDLYERLGAN